MHHASRIEISESALKNNLRFIRKSIGAQTKFSSVIKGNAYGHGISTYLPLAERLGVNHFSVFSADEAWYAFEAKKESTELMIMGMVEDEAIDWAIANDISLYIFDFERTEAVLTAAKKRNKKARLHLEIETGLHRTGFDQKHLRKIARFIDANKDYLELEGVCTHYAGGESIGNYHRIMSQIKTYHERLDELKKIGVAPKFRHTACSAPSLRYPETIMDMVRIGILQYGFWPSRETYIDYSVNHNVKSDPLKRVISWKSTIMSLKDVSVGQYVSYGTSFQASRDMCIATIPVGYCHGFSRSLSNLGRVLVGGRRASVIGLVNMNMIIIDVTNFKDVKKGDEVVLVGKQKSNSISLSSFSDLSNKLNYESLVRLPKDIPRVVVS